MINLLAALAAAPMTFAIVGDYGKAGVPEADVAALVKSWNPAYIVTTGDNNYETGSASTIDANIGQYYHEFIFGYTGGYGAGSSTRRFYPVLGNHDWGNAANNPAGANPYLAYFDLPGIERYYTFQEGDVRFFMLDSDANEPDGITAGSVQAAWLQSQLNASLARYNLVMLHHAPYSSAQHGPNLNLQWPYAAWGADTVIAGHDHSYERLLVDGIPYFVNGLGGKSIYSFVTIMGQSQFRFNGNYGAQRATADPARLSLEFITRAGVSVEAFQVPCRYPLSLTAISGTVVGPLENLYKNDGLRCQLQNPEGKCQAEAVSPAPLSPTSLQVTWISRNDSAGQSIEQVHAWDNAAAAWVNVYDGRVGSLEVSHTAPLPAPSVRFIDGQNQVRLRFSYNGGRLSRQPTNIALDLIRVHKP